MTDPKLYHVSRTVRRSLTEAPDTRYFYILGDDASCALATAQRIAGSDEGEWRVMRSAEQRIAA